MKNILLVCSAILFFSCGEEKDCCFNLDTAIDVSLISSNGVDLINNENNMLDYTSSPGISYWQNGQVSQTGSGLSPILVDRDNRNCVRFFANPSLELNTKQAILIKWNNYDTDTLEAFVISSSNSVMITEVWFNGELHVTDNERLFVIEKQ